MTTLRVAAFAVFAGILLTAACEDNPTGTTPPAHTSSCLGTPAVPLAGALPDTLRASDGPFRLTADAYADNLFIEPGTLVCADSGAQLQVTTRLVATGTADAPVTLTAADPTRPWGGVQGMGLSGSMDSAVVRMTHALVEDADTGVNARYVYLNSVRIRQIAGFAVLVDGGSLTDVVVDTVGSGVKAGRSINRWSHPSLTIKQVVVRHSGGVGVDIGYTNVTISSLRIEAPAHSGLVFYEPNPTYWVYSIAFLQPISISGQGEYLVDGWADAVAHFLTVYGDSLRPGDRVRSLGNASNLVVPAGVIWTAEPDFYSLGPPAFDSVDVEPGAQLQADGAQIGALHAAGTADQPAVLTGGTWQIENPGHVSLDHARVSSVLVVNAADTASCSLSDVLMADGGAELHTPGATLEGVSVNRGHLVLDGAGSSASGLEVSGGDASGLVLAGDSSAVQHCVVEANAGDGIHVTSGAGIRINDCDFERNGGAGVANESADTVDAAGNWWGDAAGPLGPNGDGVQGAVDYASPLASPRAPAPVTLSLVPVRTSVRTADSLRFQIQALDDSGNWVSPALFELRPADDHLLFPDSADPYLAVGRSPGTAHVDAVFRRDTTLRASADVDVLQGAPYMEWTYVDTAGAGSVLPFTPTQFVVGTHNRDGGLSGEVRFWRDGTLTTTQLPEDGRLYFWLELGGTSLDDVWATLSQWQFALLEHWDGSAWSVVDSLAGNVHDIWAVSDSSVFFMWGGGIRLWHDGAWTDAWTSQDQPSEYGCYSLVVVSATEAFVRCVTDAQADSSAFGDVIRYDGSTWQRLDIPTPPSELIFDGRFAAAPDGRLLLLNHTMGAVLEDNVWRTFALPANAYVSSYLPVDNGAYFGTADGLFAYLDADLATRTVWVKRNLQSFATYTYMGLTDIRRAGGAIFIVGEDGVRRGESPGTGTP